ncbi:hypothetical protein A0H81_04429 [Grifola frondosa]|uniref:Uncharacterized protein n=1 Tax=Grifola frondosa TaxID=5627 RepID=A0A1C7MJP2_GRIFR|nr:hypothetical protein A0H81_04429 [Grifola frondosa]
MPLPVSPANPSLHLPPTPSDPRAQFTALSTPQHAQLQAQPGQTLICVVFLSRQCHNHPALAGTLVPSKPLLRRSPQISFPDLATAPIQFPLSDDSPRDIYLPPFPSFHTRPFPSSTMACSSTTIHPIFAPDHYNPSTSTHRYSQQHTPSYIPPWHPFPQSMLFDRWPAAPNATHVWPSSPPDFLLPYHHGALNPFYLFAPRRIISRSSLRHLLVRLVRVAPARRRTGRVHRAPRRARATPISLPTFLQYDLPDDDEDLSHPPYTSRPHKRKRAAADDDDDEGADAESSISRGKRRALGAGWSGSGGGLPVRSTMQRPHRDAVLGRGARAF